MINMENKYQAVVGSNLFGFEIFEEIFETINKQKTAMHDPNFRAGVSSAEAAVRRLREEYYNAISVSNENLNHY